MPKMLSPSDMEKLPSCKREPFGKCSKENYDNIDPKQCVYCLMANIFHALSTENIADATHLLNGLYRLLKELDAIKEWKP